MIISRIENISKDELADIAHVVGEAFIANELFHNWGTEKERRENVMRYMKLYVDCVYESQALYANEQRTGFIGLIDSRKTSIFLHIKMLVKMLFSIKISDIKSFLSFANQIKDSNKKYTSIPHLETLMVCVKKENQGEGIATELIKFAKEESDKIGLPLLFDTDMQAYAYMYEYFGCEIYNKTTADNGVTRYSLVYNKELANV